MTLLRRTLFGVLVAAVALAVGIAVGGGPLQGPSTQPDVLALSKQNSAISAELHQARLSGRVDAAVGAAATPALVAGRLRGASVAVFVLPGVQRRDARGVVDALREAGAVNLLDVQISSGYVDPGRKAYVASVAANASHGVRDIPHLARLAPYQRLGALLARAYTGHASSLAVDSEARRIAGQLVGAKLVSVDGSVQRRASLAVVLGPGSNGRDDLTYATTEIETALVAALTRASDAVLVAAYPGAARPGGLLDGLRVPRPARLATFDAVGTASAGTVAVLALTGLTAGETGTYGLVHGRVQLPPGLAAPTR